MSMILNHISINIVIITMTWKHLHIFVIGQATSTFWKEIWTNGTLTLSQWSSSGNPVAIQCAWNLDLSVHWNATGEMPVYFQWSSSGLTVAFQWSSSVFQLCKLTLDRHWDTTGC